MSFVKTALGSTQDLNLTFMGIGPNSFNTFFTKRHGDLKGYKCMPIQSHSTSFADIADSDAILSKEKEEELGKNQSAQIRGHIRTFCSKYDTAVTLNNFQDDECKLTLSGELAQELSYRFQFFFLYSGSNAHFTITPIINNKTLPNFIKTFLISKDDIEVTPSPIQTEPVPVIEEDKDTQTSTHEAISHQMTPEMQYQMTPEMQYQIQAEKELANTLNQKEVQHALLTKSLQTQPLDAESKEIAKDYLENYLPWMNDQLIEMKDIYAHINRVYIMDGRAKRVELTL